MTETRSGHDVPETGMPVEPMVVDKYAGRPEPRDPNRRFEVSGETFSRERLAAVRETYEQLKTARPDFLGLTLYGSMTNGRAIPESDIDCSVFIDANEVLKNESDREMSTFVYKTRSGHSASSTEFDDKLTTKFRGMFTEVIRSISPGISPDQVKHVAIIPLSREIIDFHIQEFVDYINAIIVWRQKTKEREFYLEGGVDENAAPLAPQKPIEVEASRNLSQLFNLQVGHGLDELREYLIDKLLEMDVYGELVWKAIIRNVEALEQRGIINTDKRYPRVLEEAKKFYGHRH